MVKPVRKTTTKNPPILSQEFIIQNHADIISCVAMFIVAGLMVQATAPISATFITLQHNVTDVGEVPLFSTGVKDLAAIFFYSLICIVVHAVIQEYILDKISKKLHLSKSKLAIFNTSGQLTAFYAIAVGFGIDIIVIREHFLPDVNLLWANYPAPMSFLMKLFLIVQLAYYLHELPELYFQRTKKEDYVDKANRSIAALLLIAVPYFLNFNRLLICLLVIHYTSELINNICKLIQTADKEESFTKVTRIVSSTIFVLARLISVVLAVVTLWYGFAYSEQQPLDIKTGSFNTLYIRLALLGGILVLQLYLTFTFIGQEVAHARESTTFIAAQRAKPSKKEKPKKTKREESDLPEVDQNINKNLRNRTQKVK